MTDQEFNDCDNILKYIIDFNMENITTEFVKHNVKIINFDIYVSMLLDDNLVVAVLSNQYSPYLRITPAGRRVMNQGGYNKFRTDLLKKQETSELKERLEMEHLTQSVKINKWQYRFMIVGAIGGLLSFLILVFQFLDGFFK